MREEMKNALTGSSGGANREVQSGDDSNKSEGPSIDYEEGGFE